MDFTVVQYLGFIVAALILIWAVIEVNKRLYRRNEPRSGDLHSWVELDTKHLEAREDLAPDEALFDDEEDKSRLQVRARQNGHHSLQSDE